MKVKPKKFINHNGLVEIPAPDRGQEVMSLSGKGAVNRATRTIDVFHYFLAPHAPGTGIAANAGFD